MHGFSDSFQEAILRLSGVCSLEQLEEAVQEALECALPNVVSMEKTLYRLIILILCLV